MINENETQTNQALILATQKQNESQEQTLTLQAIAEPISIKPSIAESERFIQFLNKRFSLGLRNDLIVLIHETSPNIKGYFRSTSCSKIWNLSFKQQNENEPKSQPLNSIVLSSHELKDTPYQTLAHELAHYTNFINGVKDCSSNQYHNKQFKKQAEKMLLIVEKDKTRGYAYTTESDEFKNMLNNEFKPSQDAFKIFQDTNEPKEKKKSRLLLFSCGCGCKIRTARNEDKPLKAICSYCNTEFKEVLN